MINQLSSAPYYKSLNRPILVFGIERSLLFSILGICLPIAFSAHFRPVMDLVSAVLFMSLYSLVLILNRTDPQMLILYCRYLRYDPYYLAQPNVNSKVTETVSSVPQSYKLGKML